jgi:hypothetical protein
VGSFHSLPLVEKQSRKTKWHAEFYCKRPR